MQKEEFLKKFTAFVRSKDNISANMVLMVELGRLLVEKREDFIHILQFSGIYVGDQTYTPITDMDLVNLFIQNSSNRKLLLGAAFLISHNNKFSGADGTEYTSPVCADAMNMTMTSYFCGSKKSGMDGDRMSYFEGDPEFLGYSSGEGDAPPTGGNQSGGGAGPKAGSAGYVAAATAGLGLISNIVNSRAQKNANDPTALIGQQQQAKSALLQGVLDAKKQQLATQTTQAAAVAAENAATAKSKRTKMIIIGASVGGILLIAGIVVVIKVLKNKNKSH